MLDLLNKFSSYVPIVAGGNTGNSIINNKDTAVLATEEYSCNTDGTNCAGPGNMVILENLDATMQCTDDSARCILDGSHTRRCIYVYGTNGATLTIRAITFKDGEADSGAAIALDGAIIDLILCQFSGNKATGENYEQDGGGAIYLKNSVTHNTLVNIYATTFVNNVATFTNKGKDIYVHSGAFNIHNTCPEPFSGNTPEEGDPLEAFPTSSDPNLHSYTCRFNCPEGNYNPTGGVESSSCQPCPAGRYSSLSGVTSCSACPAGQYGQDSGATSDATCTTCPIGTYSENEGMPLCSVCEKGKYNHDDSTSPSKHISCDVCTAGKYNPDPATDAALHLSCEACRPGKWNADAGVTQFAHDEPSDCFSCDVGKFSNDPNGATSCEPCDAGLISGSGASSCSTCPVGYQCIEGVVSSTCLSGKYSNGGTNGCDECEPGYKCPGGTDHIPCPPGSYSGSASQTFCNSCVSGKFQSDEAKESCDECQPGHFCPDSSFTEIACQPGSTFQPDYSQSFCKPCSNCPLGEIMTAECTTTTDRQCSPCQPGEFSDDGLVCKQCDGEGEYSDSRGGEIGRGAKDGRSEATAVVCIAISLTTLPVLASLIAASSCKVSPAGTKASENRNSVETCPKNTFSIGAADACSPCQNGGYSSLGSFACKNCPQYSYFNETEQACACVKSFKYINGTCSCTKGETLMGTFCQPCEKGKWKDQVGVKSCFRCEDTLKGSITVNLGSTGETECKCPKGTYDKGAGGCVGVEEGMNNDLVGMKLDTVDIEPGFWRTGPGSKDVRECLISEGAERAKRRLLPTTAQKLTGLCSSLLSSQHVLGATAPVCAWAVTRDPIATSVSRDTQRTHSKSAKNAMRARWTQFGRSSWSLEQFFFSSFLN